MKQPAALILACVLAALGLSANHSLADGTNSVAKPAQENVKVVEDGPLKKLAIVVLKNGTKKQLDSSLANALGLATNDGPFEIFELDPQLAVQLGLIAKSDIHPGWIFPNWVYVSQHPGNTDIIFKTSERDMGLRYEMIYLTSPNGALIRATTNPCSLVFNKDSRVVASGYESCPLTNEWIQKSFQVQIDYWSQKLKVPVKKSDETK
jgi:hypothetical protein